MAYVLIENGVVVQKQPMPQEGFVEAPDDVVCGSTFDGAAFSAPAPTPAPIPVQVPMAAARKVLLRHGHDDAAVRNAISASSMTDAQKAEALIDWEFKTVVRRDSALTLALMPLLGISADQADAMFVEAAGPTV